MTEVAYRQLLRSGISVRRDSQFDVDDLHRTAAIVSMSAVRAWKFIPCEFAGEFFRIVERIETSNALITNSTAVGLAAVLRRADPCPLIRKYGAGASGDMDISGDRRGGVHDPISQQRPRIKEH